MSDLVVDSSVVAKWILPEADSNKAQDLLTKSGAKSDRLIVLDLAFPEAASAIWKRHRQRLITFGEAEAFLDSLIHCPVQVEAAARLLKPALQIAIRYERSIYDSLFVALAQELSL